MGICKNCAYSRKEEGIFGKYYCIYHTDARGNYNYVDANASCKYFSERSSFGNSGYTGSSGSSGCFLTSACVTYFGKPDDCYELETLRKFRDEEMKKMDGGEELVKEYYRVAPEIVKCIDASEHKGEHYQYIFDCVQTCVQLIEQGKADETLAEYKKMVITLKDQFSL